MARKGFTTDDDQAGVDGGLDTCYGRRDLVWGQGAFWGRTSDLHPG